MSALLRLVDTQGMRVAWSEIDGEPRDLLAERIMRPEPVGSIWRARLVQRFEGGVGIVEAPGLGKARLARSVKGTKPGDLTTIQISSRPRAPKLPEATLSPTLAGMTVSLQPLAAPEVLLSKRAKAAGVGPVLLQEDRPGRVTLRTAASMVARESVVAELAALRRVAATVDDEGGAPGCLVPAPPLWLTLLRDLPPPVRLLCPRHLRPAVGLTLKTYGLGEDLAAVEIDGDAALPAMEELISGDRPLPGGGSLRIDETRALTTIDVDAGQGAPVKANAAAVGKIAEAVRLGNLSGLIVIDPAGFPRNEQAIAFIDAMTTAFAHDPAAPHLAHRLSPLGLFEMSRRRRGPSLPELYSLHTAELKHDGNG